MKEFYELRIEDMRGAGLSMGYAHTTTIERKQYDQLYKAISEANKYHRENYPNHDQKEVMFRALTKDKWTSGDMSCVMYNIYKLEIK